VELRLILGLGTGVELRLGLGLALAYFRELLCMGRYVNTNIKVYWWSLISVYTAGKHLLDDWCTRDILAARVEVVIWPDAVTASLCSVLLALLAQVLNVIARYRFHDTCHIYQPSELLTTHKCFDSPERVLQDHVSLYKVRSRHNTFSLLCVHAAMAALYRNRP